MRMTGLGKARFATSMATVLVVFASLVPVLVSPVTAAAQGASWLAGHGSVPAIRQITGGGTVSAATAGLPAGSWPYGIAAGPNGTMWFAIHGTVPAIVRITSGGTITVLTAGLPAGSYPEAITAGPNGTMWFTDVGTRQAIGRVTASGAFR